MSASGPCWQPWLLADEIHGMIMAGTIGAVVGAYFLTRGRRALIPLMIGHGLVDTVSQTIYFFA